MIRSIRHKGLKRLYEQGERRGVPPDLVDKLTRILARLDVAKTPEQMDVPGLKLHSLKGDRSGCWSVGARRESMRQGLAALEDSGRAVELDDDLPDAPRRRRER